MTQPSDLRRKFQQLKGTRRYRKRIDELKRSLDGNCTYCGHALFEDEVVMYRHPEEFWKLYPDMPRSFINRTWHYQVDHVIPLSRGGTNDFSNFTLACPTCNNRKGSRLDDRATSSKG
jgi:5-methylcytosine-specific restriction endonuclease McrA